MSSDTNFLMCTHPQSHNAQVRTFLVPALETEGPAIRTWRAQGDSGSVASVTYLDLVVRPTPLARLGFASHYAYCAVQGRCMTFYAYCAVQGRCSLTSISTWSGTPCFSRVLSNGL